MGQSDKVQVISLSRNPVLHHGEALPREPPGGVSNIKEISRHIESHLGQIETVFHEFISDMVHVDVHVVNPTPDYPHYRLVTSGMSDLPMSIPEGSNCPKFLELMITLPGDWRLTHEAFEDERWYWPVRLLIYLARFPHKHRTWLDHGHTIDHANPPTSYAPDTMLTGAMLLPPFKTPDTFHELTIDEAKRILFFSVTPLYAEEIRLKMHRGSSVLVDRLVDAGIGDLIDPARPNVALETPKQDKSCGI
jgi:hypothetical protein